MHGPCTSGCGARGGESGLRFTGNSEPVLARWWLGLYLVGSTGFEQGQGENGQHSAKKRGRPIGYVCSTGVLHAGCGASSCAAQRGGGGANPRRWTAKSHPQVAFFASAVAGLSGFSGEEQSLDGVDAVGYPDHRFIGYLSHHFAGVAVAHRDDGAADCFVH